MNMEVHISFQVSAFIFFGQIPRNGTVGVYRSSVFNFWMKLHTVSIVFDINSQPHQQCTDVFNILHILTYTCNFFFFCLFDNGHSHCALMCIFLFPFNLFYFIGVALLYNVVLISGVRQRDSVIHLHIFILFQILFPRWFVVIEHLVLYLLVICISSLKKISIQMLCHFKIRLFVFFCYLVVWVIYIFWILNPYQIYYLKFSHSVGCLFILLMVFFVVQKFSLHSKATSHP